MKSIIKSNVIQLMTIVISLFIGPAAFGIELCADGTTDVLNGEYKVSNNIWGEGAGEQCINVNGNSFQVTYSTHTNGSQVKAYPFIYKGCHWGGCTADINRNLPIQVSKISTATFTFDISTDGVSGTYNASFECWFSLIGAADPAGGAELMVQINYAGGSFLDGSRPTVNIGGYTWEVNYQDWDWNYIAYVIRTPVQKVTNLNLRDFIADAVSRGYINTSWYLDNMEAGFEIWAGGTGLTTNSFSATVTGEALPIIPPTNPPASETPVTGVWYKILAGHSGRSLEVANSSTADNALCQQWDYTGGQNQQWQLQDMGGGYYRLIARHSNKCLEVQDWSTSDGANVVQGAVGDNYQNNEQWSFVKEGNYYQIINRNSGKLADVQSCSPSNGGKIHQWSYYSENALSQRWSFIIADSSATQPPTVAPTMAPTAAPGGTLGDANGSGSIDIVDALLIAQYYVGLNPQGFVSSNADTNCSGGIDIVDALLVAQYYVGLISRFC